MVVNILASLIKCCFFWKSFFAKSVLAQNHKLEGHRKCKSEGHGDGACWTRHSNNCRALPTNHRRRRVYWPSLELVPWRKMANLQRSVDGNNYAGVGRYQCYILWCNYWWKLVSGKAIYKSVLYLRFSTSNRMLIGQMFTEKYWYLMNAASFSWYHGSC